MYASTHTADLLRSIASVPKVLPQILPPFLPYAVVVAAFAAFVAWNGGIVLGMCLVTDVLILKLTHGSRRQVESRPSLSYSSVVLLCGLCDVDGLASTSCEQGRGSAPRARRLV